jgi:opacity protein-like surface antigen
MKRTVLGFATFALALTVSASAAHAQRPVSFGIAAGAAIPSGDLGKVQSMGYNVTGSVGLSTPALPISFRLDGMFNQLSGKDVSGFAMPDVRVLGLSANAQYTLPGVAVRPYLIGGVGYYSSKANIDGAESSNDLGLNAGVGARFALGGLSTYAEARFHNVFMKDDSTGEKSSMQFSPISFGIQF